MSDLTSLSIAELRDGFRSGEFTAREIAEQYNAAVAGRGRSTPTRSRRRRTRLRLPMLPTRREAAASSASLAGIPLGIKDLFATRGVNTTAGSSILKDFKPRYESTVTANLRKAGAGMLGKLNMDEFAMGSSNETSTYGPVISPWRRKRRRQCRARSGRVVGRFVGGGGGGHRSGGDRHGHGRLDPPAGGLHRHLRDQADLRALLALGHRLLRKLARPGGADGADGPRLRDHARGHGRVRPEGFDLARSCRCRIGKPDYRAISRASASVFPRNIGSTECPPTSTPCGISGIEWLRDAGAEIVEISLPHTKYALPTYYIIAPAEASSNLARYDGVRYGAAGRQRGRPRRHVCGDARRRFRRRSPPPHHDRHLCALRRLLRRLFHQGAEGPHADQAGLRAGVREVRPDPDADGAVRGVRAGRQDAPIRSPCI